LPTELLVESIFLGQKNCDRFSSPSLFSLLHLLPEGFELNCPKCQFENPEGMKFCGECGSKLELVCAGCEARILVGKKFWRECGHDLKTRKEPTPINYVQPQSYTPKHLAEKIITTRAAIVGERNPLTVMFADVANFTSLSERLDPEEVHQIMDGRFKILTEEIHRYEGNINQFTGDGVMALFGAPVAHEDHANRACHAVLNIQKTAPEYVEEISNGYGVQFKMHIGLNSGPVIVGTIGDDLRMDYTPVGDTTNLASRMEGMAQPGKERARAASFSSP
jgi:class 3 adenylate cyclase